MYYIDRTIRTEVEKWFFKKKVIVIYGARQVGKTTFVKHLIKHRAESSIYLNCDEPDIRSSLSDQNTQQLRQLIGNSEILVIDEAQRVNNIEITLKLLVDNFPGIQVVVTGSSSLDLAVGVREPLTGRKIEFNLFPFSCGELLGVENRIDYLRSLPSLMIFGTYPEVVTSTNQERLLREISEAYLYRDLLQIQQVRNIEQLRKLLQALALQIGSEVSYPELGAMLNLDKETISRYVQVLIQTHVIFELPPFKRNLRNTLGKLRKIYFCDLGIRNSLINNFNPLELRNDVGALWENYCAMERRKFNENHMNFPNIYFWRAYNKAEIDYIEEIRGGLKAFEFKYSEERAHPPRAFFEAFPDTPFLLINHHNILDFIT